MIKEMAVKDVLLAAANIIQQRGLIKGVFGTCHGPVCARGAVQEVLNGKPGVCMDIIEEGKYFTKVVEYLAMEENANIFASAALKVAKWSNKFSTTADDVVRAFRGAAELLSTIEAEQA